MLNTDSAFAKRETLARQIQAAFVEGQVGTHFANDKRKSFGEIRVYQNFDAGGQRRIFIRVWDDGICRVHMTKIIQVQRDVADRVDVGDVAELFELPSSTPDLGREIRRRVREESLRDSETVPAMLFDKPPEPPIPVGQLKTIAGLIQAFHDQYLSETYATALRRCVERIGTVVSTERREEWFMTETGRAVYRKLGEGETSRGADASVIELTAVIPELCQCG
jgi:hypothetical protein